MSWFVVGLSSKRRFPKNGILQMLKMDENEREDVLVQLRTDEEVYSPPAFSFIRY
jgi:hypothetical protein